MDSLQATTGSPFQISNGGFQWNWIGACFQSRSVCKIVWVGTCLVKDDTEWSSVPVLHQHLPGCDNFIDTKTVPPSTSFTFTCALCYNRNNDTALISFATWFGRKSGVKWVKLNQRSFLHPDITILLAMVFFMDQLSSQMPPMPDAVPVIGTFFVATMVLTTCSLICTIICLRLHHTKSDDQMPNWVNVIEKIIEQYSWIKSRMLLLNYLPRLLLMASSKIDCKVSGSTSKNSWKCAALVFDRLILTDVSLLIILKVMLRRLLYCAAWNIYGDSDFCTTKKLISKSYLYNGLGLFFNKDNKLSLAPSFVVLFLSDRAPHRSRGWSLIKWSSQLQNFQGATKPLWFESAWVNSI